MKKNTKTIIIIFIILAVIVSITGGLNTFTFFKPSSDVIVPIYSSVECVPIDGVDNKLISIDDFDDDPHWYGCSTGNSPNNAYIPRGESCDYILSNYNFALTKVIVCEYGGRDFDAFGCNEISSGEFDYFSINEGETVYINTVPAFLFGESSLQAKIPAYGLKVTTDDNVILTTSSSCQLSSLSNSIKIVDFDGDEIPINAPHNTITAKQTITESSRLVTLDGVNNGNPIYVVDIQEGEGVYQKVEQTEDGTYYVDIKAGNFKSSLIECIPGIGNCDDNAKIVEEGIPCYSDSDYGTALGWAISDNGDSCRYACGDDGFNVVTDDCVDTSCGDEAVFSYQSGQCVAYEDDPFYGNPTNIIILSIIGGVVILGAIYLFTRKK